MANALVVAEVEDGEVKRGTLSAISFVRAALPTLGGAYSILVLGHGVDAAARELSRFGAAQIIVCDDPSLASYGAEHHAPTVAAVARDYGLVVATATSFGKDLMPRVAARLDAAYAGDCAGVGGEDGRLVYRRPMFAGNAFGWCTLDTATQVATVRQSEFPAAEPAGGFSPIVTIGKTSPGGAAARIEIVSMKREQSERPELGDASVVVSGGRALKNRFFEVLEPLATTLGAALGASRAAVDAGYAPGDLQVGQTGKIVAPKLYLAFGISGAIQHIAGMNGSRVIVAVNTDPQAPIFEIADYGLIGDLFEVVPALVTELRQRSA
jgi:electron transfer flavoprotein alpha subunit